MRQRRTAAQIGPVQNRRKNLAPLVVRKVGKVRLLAKRGVVHEDIETAEAFDGRGDERGDRIGARHVSDSDGRAAARPPDLLSDGIRLVLGRARVHADRGSGARKRQGDGAAEVPSAAGMIRPALAPALMSSAPSVQQAASLLPITFNSVSITGVANSVLQLVANATTAVGHTFQVPLTLTNTTPSATTPILDLHIGAIHLNVLGLKVDTSEICLKITAESGPGNLLGNLLGNVAHLLDQGLNLGQILGSLTSTQLSDLSMSLSGLLGGALGAIGSPINAATGGASVSSIGTTQILHLSLGPVDLNLLGLVVHLDNCNNGLVTVDIGTVRAR